MTDKPKVPLGRRLVPLYEWLRNSNATLAEVPHAQSDAPIGPWQSSPPGHRRTQPHSRRVAQRANPRTEAYGLRAATLRELERAFRERYESGIAIEEICASFATVAPSALRPPLLTLTP